MIGHAERYGPPRRWRRATATVTAALVSGLLAAAPAVTASEEHLSPVRSGHASAARTVPGVAVLYSQNDHDTGAGIDSTHYTRDPLLETSRGADDFRVPAGETWTVTDIAVTGRSGGSILRESVVFFSAGNGLPGDRIAAFKRLHGKVSGSGSFQISLGEGVVLPAGKYWVSVQAFSSHFWVWEMGSRLHGSPAAWKNPPDGFGTGCTRWGILTDCVGGGGPDFMFALQGTAS